MRMLAAEDNVKLKGEAEIATTQTEDEELQNFLKHQEHLLSLLQASQGGLISQEDLADDKGTDLVHAAPTLVDNLMGRY